MTHQRILLQIRWRKTIHDSSRRSLLELMKIKSSKKLNSSDYDVWEILRDPGNMPAWNPKCYTSTGNRDVTVGSHFEATFKLRGKTARTALCEVIELKPCEKITIRYSGEAFPANGYVDETFYLISQGPRQTKLELVVDFTHSGLPLYFKFIMWAISSLGHQAGPSSLDGIENLL